MGIFSNWNSRRKLRKSIRGCKKGNHGKWLSDWQPAVGGREIRKCYNCGRVISERPVSIKSAKKG